MEYIIKDLDLIKNNYEEFKSGSIEKYKIFQKKFNSNESTWKYKEYNFFTIPPRYDIFYYLLKEINIAVKEYLNDDKPIWMQSWVNFHEQNQVLDWHNHSGWDFHGYISIVPYHTKTLFRDWHSKNSSGKEWEIDNQIGRLYLGRSNVMHKVEVVKPFIGKRITIGLDFTLNGEKSTQGNLIPL